MTELAGLTLASPVMIAAGCGGTGRELASYADLASLGGFVTRTITLDPREGGPMPRVEQTPSGFVHAVGLQNPGLEPFLALELPWLAQQGVRTIVSIAGSTLGEIADLARRLVTAPGVSGVELNLSQPDGLELGLYDAREPFQAARAVGAVRREVPTGFLLSAKLAADPVRVVESARLCAEAGVDALVLANAVPALMADGRPAGLSGPAVGPLARRCVADVHRALPDLPLIGAGGVTTSEDARVLLRAGATAVQVGSALLHDPTTAARIAADLRGDDR